MAVSSWPNPRFFAALILLILISLSFVAADDVKLDDDDSPKSPSCNNPYELVILLNPCEFFFFGLVCFNFIRFWFRFRFVCSILDLV
jgi:hypothetical protein